MFNAEFFYFNSLRNQKKIDVKPRKNAKTARQFHIKKRLQEESRRVNLAPY